MLVTETSEMVASHLGPVLIIDGPNEFLRCAHAYSFKARDGREISGPVGFIRTLAMFAQKFSASKIITAWEFSKNNWRTALVPNYKANRDRTLAERASQLLTMCQFLRCMPLSVLYVSGFEADDIISVVANDLSLAGSQKIIVSNDSDMLQLACTETSVYSQTKKILHTENSILASMAILPKNIAIYKAVCGDRGDNVDGLLGVGIKKLTHAFPELATTVFSVGEFLALADSRDSTVARKIRQNKSVIETNHSIVKLPAATVCGSIGNLVSAEISNEIQQLDTSTMLRLSHELGLNLDIQCLIDSFATVIR